MSQSLLKRCLQIVEDDLPSAKSSTKPTKPVTKSKKAQDTFSKGNKGSIFEMIPQSQRLTCTARIGKSKEKQIISKIKPNEKFTVKQAQNRLKRGKDQTDENVQKLLALDRAFKLDDETTELLIKRARTGHYVIPEQKPKDDEDVFTDEDFAKFEREYFCK